jgi:hypothetical protein
MLSFMKDSKENSGLPTGIAAHVNLTVGLYIIQEHRVANIDA